MIKNLKKALNKTNKFIIAFLVIIFSFLSYLSIPALYEYDSLQKELSKKNLEVFNLNLSLSNEIKYHIFPSPNFTITDNLLSFDENKIGDGATWISSSILCTFSIPSVLLFNFYLNIPMLYLFY